jgi:hypothetical protein
MVAHHPDVHRFAAAGIAAVALKLGYTRQKRVRKPKAEKLSKAELLRRLKEAHEAEGRGYDLDDGPDWRDLSEEEREQLWSEQLWRAMDSVSPRPRGAPPPTGTPAEALEVYRRWQTEREPDLPTVEQHEAEFARVEEMVAEALEIETDENWHRRLLGASAYGGRNHRRALRSWLDYRKQLLSGEEDAG